MLPQTPPASPLVEHLKQKNILLYGKLAELRGEVTRWLTYIPETFSHYTSHTIDHSDEIILQISKILFKNNNKRPRPLLGAIETYILIASAYLHDAGMVTSEQEKLDILTSDEWSKWTTEGSGSARWSQIQQLREKSGADPVKNFAIDRATRLMIAEYIRRQHHQRAGSLIQSRSLELGRIDVGDPLLRNAIAEVCIAHGLDTRELEDNEKYPEACDILGERVNLRLLSTLLRIGDLLDLRHDRACPLLLQAACPLPADSHAHWSQYSAIKKRLTTPDRIEIKAECKTQDEHRVLHDWCTWLVKEMGTLPSRLPQTEWKPPYASMQRGATIEIKPAHDATYIPGKWAFELDEDAIFQRLISDVYDTPNVFIRELIQNALDATRCQMHLALSSEGVTSTPNPADLPETLRERYPIKISTHEETKKNEITNETETIQTITVEDNGIGMDLDVIQRYLLQVGRSFYTTTEFRRTFTFQPTSRFGIGFLSTFAASDDITIDTYKPSSKRPDGPIRLKLAGPRSYILTEKSDRVTNGTRIAVKLKKPLKTPLTEIIQKWCVFTEFPIVIDDNGRQTTITAENHNQYNYTKPHPLVKEATIHCRSHPFKTKNFRGHVVTVSVKDNQSVRWLNGRTREEVFKYSHDNLSTEPASITTFHGILLDRDYERDEHVIIRLDCRGSAPVTLSRTYPRRIDSSELDTVLEELVSNHLDGELEKSRSDWTYRLRLAADHRLAHLKMWRSRRDMVPYWINGKLHLSSLTEFAAHVRWYLPSSTAARLEEEEQISQSLPRGSILLSRSLPSILGEYIPNTLWGDIFFTSRLIDVETVANHLVSKIDRSSTEQNDDFYFNNRSLTLLAVPNDRFDAAWFGGRYGCWTALNQSTEFGAWYMRVRQACHEQRHGLTKERLERLDKSILSAVHYQSISEKDLTVYIKIWNQSYGHIPELACPVLTFVINRGQPAHQQKKSSRQKTHPTRA